VRRNATTLRQPFEERAAKQAIIRSSEMARKTFPVTDAMRERVRRLAGVGVPQHDIAAIIECDEKTLRKHFSIELNRGVAEANAAAASYLFAKVKEGNVVAQIFWMRSADLIRRFGPRSCEFPSTKSDCAAGTTADQYQPMSGTAPSYCSLTERTLPAFAMSSVTERVVNGVH
jgi:hypothetical protein